MTVAVVTSADGQWAAIRVGTRLAVIEQPLDPLAEPPLPPPAVTELASEDVELAIVMPGGIAVIERTPTPRVLLLSLPELEPVAGLELEAPAKLVAATGPRLVLGHGAQYTIVRIASRALAAQTIEPGVADFVAGMDKHQLVFGLPKKLEVWDAVSARPMLRMQLQLPPPPRVVGSALGHLFVTRPGSDEVYLYRLSDGRPFRHQAGSKVERAIGHPASGIIVLVTPRGLVRINCFAHSLTLLDTPYTPGTALALHGTGDTVQLLGLPESGEPWRIPLDTPQPTASLASPVPAQPARAVSHSITAAAIPWRLVLIEGVRTRLRGEPATLAITEASEPAQLAARLGLGPAAQRTLLVLYGCYLLGEATSIARVAELVDDWREPLGQGELGLLVEKLPDGRLRLREPVANFLDGAPPLAIRIAGLAPRGPRGGGQLARQGRPDAVLEAALLDQRGRLAVIEGEFATGLLEARLHDALALAYATPAQRPRDLANLVVVADDGSPRWVRELPAVDASA